MLFIFIILFIFILYIIINKKSKENDNLCIVTSFIDIGRGKWENGFNRSVNTYIDNFLPYLKLKEEIIVFIDKKYYDYIKEKIKNNKNITLIPIDDNFLNKNISSWKFIDTEDKIMNSDYYKNLTSHRKHHPEHSIPKYNIVQHCKLDFVKYVIDKKLTNCDYIAWSDFGYFKDMSKMPNKQISFDINSIDKNKINYSILSLSKENDDDIIEMVKNPRDIIGGFFFVANKKNHLLFNKLYKEILQNDFYNNNLVDDDQHIVLRVYLKNKTLFNLEDMGGWHNSYIKLFK